jgi:hypothetical protein
MDPFSGMDDHVALTAVHRDRMAGRDSFFFLSSLLLTPGAPVLENLYYIHRPVSASAKLKER